MQTGLTASPGILTSEFLLFLTPNPFVVRIVKDTC
jgi:hypothetical protein